MLINNKRAFTLVELSVVLIIIGLMAGLVLSVGKPDSGACYTKTKQQLGTIEAELDRFARANSRLPAPALAGQGSNNPAFGTETASGNASVTVGSDAVLVGMLPHASLGLDSSFASDCWGNRLTYAVTRSLTSSNASTGFPNPANNGQITIRSGAGGTVTTLASDMAYAVVSHGEDGFGATPLSSGDLSPRNCSGTGESKLDRENCDIAAGNLNAIFFVTDFNNGKGAANYFDDLLAYAVKPTVNVPMDCVEQSQNWPPGCGALVPGLMNNNSATVANTIPYHQGSATFTCTGGLLAISGATCTPTPDCVGNTASWAPGCSAPFNTIPYGTTLPGVGNTASGYVGQTDITCGANGAIQLSNSACNPMANCNGMTASWLTHCGRTLGNLAHGATQTVSNSNSGYTGTSDVTCTNGSLSYANATCDAVPQNCPGQTVTWGAGCQANVGPINHGASDGPYTNTNTGFTGSTNVSCTNGTLTPTSATCNANCASGTTTWGTDNRCAANYTALTHAAGATLTNATSGYTGNVTLSCSNGAITQSGATCSAPSTCSQPAITRNGNGSCAAEGYTVLTGAREQDTVCGSRPMYGPGSCCQVTYFTKADGSAVNRTAIYSLPSCGTAAPDTCTADDQSSDGDASSCCNGDSDGNGTCGTQSVGLAAGARCYAPGYTYSDGSYMNRCQSLNDQRGQAAWYVLRPACASGRGWLTGDNINPGQCKCVCL
jgi:prepilin-type N-terminal cleavage/methylation domain-containing protein